MSRRCLQDSEGPSWAGTGAPHSWWSCHDPASVRSPGAWRKLVPGRWNRSPPPCRIRYTWQSGWSVRSWCQPHRQPKLCPRGPAPDRSPCRTCRLRCPSPRSGGTGDGRRAPRQRPRADRPMSRRRPNVARTLDQPELPLAAPKRRRAASVEPEEAAKVAIARRAKPGAPPGYVRLVLSLELRRALAEQLSAPGPFARARTSRAS